jgi:hypothetical protein
LLENLICWFSRTYWFWLLVLDKRGEGSERELRGLPYVLIGYGSSTRWGHIDNFVAMYANRLTTQDLLIINGEIGKTKQMLLIQGDNEIALCPS